MEIMTTTCTGAHGIAAAKLCVSKNMFDNINDLTCLGRCCAKSYQILNVILQKKKRKITYTYSIYNHYISAIFEMNSESNNHYISAIFEMNSEVASS